MSAGTKSGKREPSPAMLERRRRQHAAQDHRDLVEGVLAVAAQLPAPAFRLLLVLAQQADDTYCACLTTTELSPLTGYKRDRLFELTAWLDAAGWIQKTKRAARPNSYQLLFRRNVDGYVTAWRRELGVRYDENLQPVPLVEYRDMKTKDQYTRPGAHHPSRAPRPPAAPDSLELPDTQRTSYTERVH